MKYIIIATMVAWAYNAGDMQRCMKKYHDHEICLKKVAKHVILNGK